MHNISIIINNIRTFCWQNLYTHTRIKRKIDDARVEYAIIYMENEIHELERAARLLRRRHPLFLFHPTNQHTSIKHRHNFFFAFIYHLLERVTWHTASTIQTHTLTHTYIHSNTHIPSCLYTLTTVYLLRFILFCRHMMTNAIQITC